MQRYVNIAWGGAMASGRARKTVQAVRHKRWGFFALGEFYGNGFCFVPLKLMISMVLFLGRMR